MQDIFFEIANCCVAFFGVYVVDMYVFMSDTVTFRICIAVDNGANYQKQKLAFRHSMDSAELVFDKHLLFTVLFIIILLCM